MVLEEPFVTRDAILAVLRPGEITSERPFRTLRQRQAASNGIPVVMRSTAGQVLGRVYVYSALNADAARAYRLNRVELAQELAVRARRIEESREATLVHQMIVGAASHMPVDPLSREAPVSLRRYLNQRRSTWRALDVNGLAREWLIHGSAWMSTDSEFLVEALIALDRSAEEARVDVLGETSNVTTFFGRVARMDSTAAELEGGDGQALLVPREDLDRQGLAVLGQAVALLREELPGGGSYCLPMPAIALETPPITPARPVWATDFDDDGAIPVLRTSRRDIAWLDRALAREPTAVPATPLRVA